jgi:hypothetical protein
MRPDLDTHKTPERHPGGGSEWQREPEPYRTLVVVLLIVSLAILALPVLAVRMPPLLDYPNHLARMWLIAGGAEAQPMSRFWAIAWNGVVTNIGIDLAAAAFGRIIPVDAVGTIAVIASLVLPPLGAILLSRSIFGRWHWWQIGIVVIAWNPTFLVGFLNFNIALGLALLAAGLDRRLVQYGPMAAALGRFIVGAVLCVVHPFGTFYYAVLVGGLALGRDYAPLMWLRSAASAAARSLAAGLAAGLPMALSFVITPTRPGAHRPDQPLFEYAPPFPRNIAPALSSPFRTYDLKVDLLVPAVLIVIAGAALLLGRMRVHAGLILAAGALVVLAAGVPTDLAGTGWLDRRAALMALFAGMAAVELNFKRGRFAVPVAALVLFAVVVARCLWIGSIWTAERSDLASVEKVLANVPEGAKLFAVEHSVSAQDRRHARLGRFVTEFVPSYGHFAARAVPLRHAFVPTLFSAIGKQPLRVLPPVDEISVPDGMLYSARLLTAAPADIPSDATYLKAWRTRFDFVLVLNADMPDEGGPIPAVPELTLVADEGFAQLYKISRTEP